MDYTANVHQALLQKKFILYIAFYLVCRSSNQATAWGKQKNSCSNTGFTIPQSLFFR